MRTLLPFILAAAILAAAPGSGAQTAPPKELTASERALVAATRLQPENWLPWMRLTDFRLFVQKDAEGAMDAVRTAIYLNPRSWDVSQRYLDVRRRLRGS